MRAFTRLGAAVALSCLSLLSFILLLPNSSVSQHLQKISLDSFDNYVPDLWPWGSGDSKVSVEEGTRLVVFGDAWVDDMVESGREAKGVSWTDVLCDEINCTSLVNFAESQPSEAYPASSPNGALTSNALFQTALESPSPRTSSYMPSGADLLPDLEAQITQFLALPASKARETIFVVSFGLWDIYHFSGLDYSLSEKLVDDTIRELFQQVDRMYMVYRQSVMEITNSTNILPFRIVVPKLFDPTLLPGWAAQRPMPLAPSSVSEQQKNAIYLTTRWNNKLENKIGAWIKNDTFAIPSDKVVEDDVSSMDHVKRDGEEQVKEPEGNRLTVLKDVFYYDLPRYLTDVIIEHQLQTAGLSDATGLGKGDAPFESVDLPCVLSAEEEHREGDTEVEGLLICEEAREYLFWDDFRLGSVANEAIGSQVAEMLRKNKSTRSTWKEGKGHGH